MTMEIIDLEPWEIAYILIGWLLFVICAFVYGQRLNRAGFMYALLSIPFPLVPILLLACLGEYKEEEK